MKRNSRLSSVLHLLLHIDEAAPRVLTSEQLAGFINTNPVVVRRTIVGLREAGIVVSERGPGGGWRLGRAPGEISIADVCAALGESLLPFSTEPESPGCAVEEAVMAALEDFRREAELLLAARLSKVTLADMVAGFRRRRAGKGVTVHAV